MFGNLLFGVYLQDNKADIPLVGWIYFFLAFLRPLLVRTQIK